jgi:hypothetical protein
VLDTGDVALEVASQRAMIENMLMRYAWAYDMDELELLGGCFANEAEVLFSNGLQIGRSAVVAELERRRAKYRPMGQTPWHVITNVFVRPKAPGETRVSSWWGFGMKEPNGSMQLSNFGWYDDRFIDQDGEWRIANRRVLSVGQR